MKLDFKKIQELSDDEIMCYCHKGDIVKAIEKGASTLEKLQNMTNAGTSNNCKELNPNKRCCHPELKILIEIYGKLENEGNYCCCKY